MILAIQGTDEFSFAYPAIQQKWRVFCRRRFRGGRFPTPSNIIYQRIGGWRDLIWHEIAHVINTIIAYHRNALFDSR